MKRRKIIFILTLCFFIAFFIVMKVLAVDQIKTTETFVASFDIQITSATSSQFSIYIGDNLAGVTNPVKSAYFTVSGVYTGGGTLKLGVDGDTATEKTFTLPSVASPTAFEILYKDDSNKINPSSAGAYTYTLNITPTGLTISGLGAKINVTHRYAPATCPDGQSANEKIKTTDFFVAGYDAQITSATSSQFSIYIGDNLAGVTNPVKSAYFTVSGVYTGGGTLKLGVDGDTATEKTFTLPSVASPTAFEILYKDDSNKINPSSAGAYTYTLNITPTGVTISGLGAKATISHRYKPPACGGGYPAIGTFISPIFDTSAVNGASFNWLMASGTTPTGKIRIQFATSNCSNGATNPSACTTGSWGSTGSDYLGPSCDSASYYYNGAAIGVSKEIGCFANHNNKRYFRYKLILCSASNCSDIGGNTPQVDDVIINWSP